jgi:DNA-binding Lrp family transcriptional regulator
VNGSGLELIMDYKQIYTRRIADVPKETEGEFPLPKKRDDPAFRGFVSFVTSVPAKFQKIGPQEGKLFGLWFAAKTFRMRWSAATKDTPRHLAWVCFMHRLNIEETFWLVLAWMQQHGRYTTEGDMTRLWAVVKQVWIDVQPELRKVRKRANAKRRQRYAQLKKIDDDLGVQPKKRGRPKQSGPNSMRARIIELLRQNRSTPQAIADELGAKPETIQSQLRRMLKEGVLVHPAKGLYGVADEMAVRGAPTLPNARDVAQPPAQAIVEPLKVVQEAEQWSVRDLGHTVVHYEEPASAEPYNRFRSSESEPLKDTAWSSLHMPTAEPRWSM